MIDRQSLETALDYADWSPDKPRLIKRRDAYATEMFFEQQVLPEIAKGATALGWCYITLKKHRWWFKSAANFNYDDSERATDKEFVSRMLSLDANQHFFIAALDRKEVEIRNLVKNGTGWNLRSLERLQETKWLIAGAKLLNDHLKTLFDKPAPGESFCRRWLSDASDTYIAALLVQRALMNIALDKPHRRFPLDLDAIELGSDAVIFHEFKRKSPCPNGYFVPEEGICSLDDLYKVRNHLRDLKFNQDKELFGFIKDQLRFDRAEKLIGFGLDLSHVNDVPPETESKFKVRL